MHTSLYTHTMVYLLVYSPLGLNHIHAVFMANVCQCTSDLKEVSIFFTG